MNFKDALASLDEDKGSCPITKWLDEQTPETQQEISTALQDLPMNKVFRACQRMGLKCAQATWHRHFTRQCRCHV
jgi:hypothetical protein